MKRCNIWKHDEIPEDELMDILAEDESYFAYEGYFWPLSWIFWPNDDVGYICEGKERVLQVSNFNGQEIDVGPYYTFE